MRYNTAMRGMLQIRLFGGLHVVCDQGDRVETIRFRSQKGKVLLAYLATFSGHHSRIKLSKLIFPNVSQAKSLLYLRVELHFLYHLLKNLGYSKILNINRDSVELKAEDIFIDIRQFEQIIENAAQVDEISRVSFLEQACQLYSGDYMDGFEAPWICAQREIYREIFLKSCEELVLIYSKYGEQQKAYSFIQYHSKQLSNKERDYLMKIISDTKIKDNLRSFESRQNVAYRVPIGMLTYAALHAQHGLISQSSISHCISLGGMIVRRSDNLAIAVFSNPCQAAQWLVDEIEINKNLSGALDIGIWQSENNNKNINMIQQLVLNLKSGWLVCTEPVAYWLQRQRKWFLQEIKTYFYGDSLEKLFVVNSQSDIISPFKITRFPLIKRQLPSSVGKLIGRETELQTLHEWLQASAHNCAPRLLTITGIGGVGKTHLALAFIHEIADYTNEDIAFVSLENVDDVAKFELLLLRALNEDVSIMYANIIETLQNYKIIILLDHIDQIRSEILKILSNILSKNRHIRIIVTARVPLGLSEEQVISLAPFPLPPDNLTDLSVLQNYDCIKLFLEEARRIRYDFHLTPSNAPQVAALCRYAGGVPGVIRMLARRLSVYTPSKLLSIIQENAIDNIDSLVAWNFHYLSEEQRRILSKLSIFEHYWTLAEASDITQEPLLHEHIEKLITAGLVVSKFEDDNFLFTISTPIRDFAMRHLSEASKKSLKQRYVKYYVSILEKLITNYKFVNYDCLINLKKYRDSLLTCIKYAIELREVQSILQIIPHLVSFFESNGLITIILQWYDILINYHMSESDKINLTCAFAHMHFRIGNLATAEVMYYRAYELAQTHCLPTKAAEALVGLAGIALDRTQISESEKILMKVFNEYDSSLTPIIRAHALLRLGHVYAAQMKVETACQIIEQACAIYREIGDKRYLALALNALGSLKIKKGALEEAENLINESLNILEEIQEKVLLIYALLRFGDLCKEHKQYKETESIYYQALEISRNIGIKSAQRAALLRLGEFYYFRGSCRIARQMFKKAYELMNETNDAHKHSMERIWYAFSTNSFQEAKILLLDYINYIINNGVYNNFELILTILSIIYKKEKHFQISYQLLKSVLKIRKKWNIYYNKNSIKSIRTALSKVKSKAKSENEKTHSLNDIDTKILSKIYEILYELGID
jgi:tetratricopeptide (TPR) repeat protein